MPLGVDPVTRPPGVRAVNRAANDIATRPGNRVMRPAGEGGLIRRVP